jgi:hypothetical protein
LHESFLSRENWEDYNYNFFKEIGVAFTKSTITPINVDNSKYYLIPRIPCGFWTKSGNFGQVGKTFF